MDLISREALIEEVKKYFRDGCIHKNDLAEVIAKLPTIDAVPVVHGENLKAKWSSLFECSVCHWECRDSVPCDSETFNFCPNCGARMDGKKNEEVPVIVVRCKDCKHYHKKTGWCKIHSHFIDYDGEACHPWENNDWKMFKDDDFCSDGERKGGAE